MRRRLFGWDYPPGAENDPNAPWNERYDDEWCEDCGVDPCECEEEKADEHTNPEG
jgi:hypothetical protein